MPTGVYPRTEKHRKMYIENGLRQRGPAHPFWKGGKPKCKDCGKKLSHYESTRCVQCASKVPKSEETRERLSSAVKKNWEDGKMSKTGSMDKNPNWKGDQVSYTGIHKWIERNWKKSDKCDFCDKAANRIEWANLTGDYSRDRKNWGCLCVSCHRKLDRKSQKWQDWFDSHPEEAIIEKTPIRD